jgi:hypothetical protein
VATSPGYTASATGTVYWVASYGGDSNNAPVTSGTAAEPVNIDTINTSQTPAYASVGSPISDTATVTGNSPTGSVTFKLYNNPNGTGTPLYTSPAVTLVGGVATSPGYTASATGTVYWVASYGGDSNNAPVTSGTAAEPVNIDSINTSQQPASASVGSSIADKATVTGNSPTGSVTFKLYNNPNGTGTPLYTSPAVTLAGGVATSPGYTATATGTVYWVASYGGDSNNAPVTSGTAAEPVTITGSTPTLTTTPGGPTTIGNFSICGTKFLDTTGSGFAAGESGQSGVTINLYQETNSTSGLQTGSCGDTLVASTTTDSNGNYCFTVSTAGTYYVQESVPSGWIQTGGGPNGSAGNTYYTVSATAGNSYSGYNFADFQMPNCCPSGITWKVNGSTVSSLTGNLQGDKVTAVLPSSNPTQVYTLVVYIAPTASWSDSNAYQQQIYQQVSGTYTSTASNNPAHSLTITVPNTYYQIDLICGPAITQLEPNQNNNAYGPDSANITYHAQNRYIGGQNGGSTAPSSSQLNQGTPLTPTPTTMPVLTDSATLSGGSSPTGTITFYLFPPGVTSSTANYSSPSKGGNYVYSNQVTISGTGTCYSTSTGTSWGSAAPTQAGTYNWVAIYSGDTANTGVTSPFGSETECVSKASPTISTVAGCTVTLGSKQKMTDTATLAGGYNPAGTIAFTLTDCKGNTVYTASVNATGDGTYSPPGYVPTATGTYQWSANFTDTSGNNNNAKDQGGCQESEQVVAPCQVSGGQFATCGFWQNTSCGQQLINQVPGSCNLGNWLATNYPHLYGSQCDKSNPNVKDLTNCSNSQVNTFYQGLCNSNASYAQIMATALACYTTDSNQAGTCAAQYGLSQQYGGNGINTWNVGSNGSCLKLSNNTSYSVANLLSQCDQQLGSQGTSGFNRNCLGGAGSIFNGINTTGNVTNATLNNSSLAYTPAQVRGAYGISGLTLDGTGQTIAIVDAYDNPAIFQSLDTFDSQFGLTASGQSLYSQYGPASSFLTVLNQTGQTTSLPATDPSGPGAANWELETALDVEWAHAMAPGAKIVLVEANTQTLPDLMASVATAASQPGVSVVSMSWGFTEGQAVFAAEEANYDSVFNVPGVTFLASTGDYGTANPEYPAFSPNVVAVGGTSLILNQDQSYNSESGWGYFSDSVGAAIGSGGGISQYEGEPAYQQGVQSLGYRTTPDVSMIADPATGAWVADTYNLGTSNPFEVAGGTSLSAPAFAGLLALADQGRVAAGQAVLNSASPTQTQQALYSLPQTDYNSITSGSNGYNANAGYNLVTGLGTPVANLMVPDLIAYQGPGTIYSGPTVSPLQDATLYGNWAAGATGTINAFNIFSALIGTGRGSSEMLSHPDGLTVGRAGPVSMVDVKSTLATPLGSARTMSVDLASSLSLSVGSFSLPGGTQSSGLFSTSTAAGTLSLASFLVASSPTASGTVAPHLGLSSSTTSTTPVSHARHVSIPGTEWSSPFSDVVVQARPRTSLVADSVLDEMAAQLVLARAQAQPDVAPEPSFLTAEATPTAVVLDANGQQNQDDSSTTTAARLAVLGAAAGLWARGAGIFRSRKRPSAAVSATRKNPELSSRNEIL